MGKGDKKSRRGKIIIGTFGVRRRKKKLTATQAKPDIKVKDVKIKEKKSSEGEKGSEGSEGEKRNKRDKRANRSKS